MANAVGVGVGALSRRASEFDEQYGVVETASAAGSWVAKRISASLDGVSSTCNPLGGNAAPAPASTAFDVRDHLRKSSFASSSEATSVSAPPPSAARH